MDIAVPVGGVRIPGYLAMPAPGLVGDGPWPGVVVVHDAMGLGDDIRAITARFATAGYLAVAPDLYSRGSTVRCLRAVMTQLRQGSGQACADIEAARDVLRSRADCTGAVGVAGFCMGGGFALLLASGFDASAPYYGHLPQDPAVLDEACPIVGSYGGRDRVLPGVAATLERALAERGIPHDVKEYPKAGHGFANRSGGPLAPIVRIAGFGYRHDVAEDAWSRVLHFFGEHLATAKA